MSKENALIKFLLDLIFPQFCVTCGREGEVWCKICRVHIEYTSAPMCPVCFMRMPGNIHASHRARTELTKLIAATRYDAIRAPLAAYKYQFIRIASAPLSTLLIRTLTPILLRAEEESRFKRESCVIVPIPLHKRRKAWRGFNHAKLLGEAVSTYFNIPMFSVLTRTRYTTPQVELKGKEREENMRDAFSISKEAEAIKGKIIFLVDDIYTTGATMNEAAKVLRASGAREVWGIVLAH